MKYFMIKGELDSGPMVVRLLDNDRVELRTVDGDWTLLDSDLLFGLDGITDLYTADEFEDPAEVWFTEIPESEVLV